VSGLSSASADAASRRRPRGPIVLAMLPKRIATVTLGGAVRGAAPASTVRQGKVFRSVDYLTRSEPLKAVGLEE